QATATPAGGPNSAEYGHGIVNPYAAVTTTVLTSPGQAPAAIEPAALRSPPDSAPPVLAVTGAGVAATGVTLGLVLAVPVPRGRGRGAGGRVAGRAADWATRAGGAGAG